MRWLCQLGGAGLQLKASADWRTQPAASKREGSKPTCCTSNHQKASTKASSEVRFKILEESLDGGFVDF